MSLRENNTPNAHAPPFFLHSPLLPIFSWSDMAPAMLPFVILRPATIVVEFGAARAPPARTAAAESFPEAFQFGLSILRPLLRPPAPLALSAPGKPCASVGGASSRPSPSLALSRLSPPPFPCTSLSAWTVDMHTLLMIRYSKKDPAIVNAPRRRCDRPATRPWGFSRMQKMRSASLRRKRNGSLLLG